MTEAKTGRHPLDQIRRTIRQKLLTTIRLDDPLAGSSLSRCGQGQEMADPLIHLIVRIPLHIPTTYKAGGTEMAPKPTNKEKTQKKKRVPMSAPFPDGRGPTRPQCVRSWRPGR